MIKLTIFTPTYNRGYILPKLFESLLGQGNKDFEWIVIDDGSTDNTPDLLKKWMNQEIGFQIKCLRTENGGKQRAINIGVEIASTDYFFIVDSDDTLTNDAVQTILEWIDDTKNQTFLVGFAGLKYNIARSPGDQSISKFPQCGYVDCTNLERKKYALTQDLAEIYKTEILKRYPFPVWDGETFTPECVVWDKIALDGYKLRYYNKYIYNFEYLPDGLTRGGYLTYKKNMMGCAMANNMKARTASSMSEKYHYIIEMLVCCILTGNIGYIFKSYNPVISIFLLPIAFAYAIRRKRILRNE